MRQPPPPVTIDARIEALLATNVPVAIGVSGGKDSQAAALATCTYLDRIRHAGPRLLIHSDLGSVEWLDSLPVCSRLAERLGVELVVVRRKAGGLMERWEARWQSSRTRYENLSTVTLVPCWSTPEMRFCTSELKTHVIVAELKRRFRGQKIVNVTGIRRQESKKRAGMAIADHDKERRIWNWRPILDWTADEVFTSIDDAGLDPHPAYRRWGMSRVSCRFCIMQNLGDMTAAAAQPEAHDIYRRMVALEIASSFGFQGGRWLADIAPHLLDETMQEAVLDAKDRAQKRIIAEREISRGMLYVKGWPTRMLTDSEADILAAVRRDVSAIMGFDSSYLTRDSIHARYAELIAAKKEKDGNKPTADTPVDSVFGGGSVQPLLV